MSQILKHLYFKEAGYAWARPSWPIEGISDNSQDALASTLQVFENGRPLGPPHALHEDIRLKGNGLFSHWRSSPSSMAMVIFSTSDNSNPNTNGRAYDFIFNYGEEYNERKNKNRRSIGDFLTYCCLSYHLDDINAVGLSSIRIVNFLAHVSRSLRVIFPWGTHGENFIDDYNENYHDFHEIILRRPPMLCGAFARALGDCAMGMGLRARPVIFPAHIAVEIEITPDRWVYFDPAFQFFAAVNGEYLSARDLAKRMDLIQAWDQHFNSTLTCTNILSHQFNMGFHEGEILPSI